MPPDMPMEHERLPIVKSELIEGQDEDEEDTHDP